MNTKQCFQISSEDTGCEHELQRELRITQFKLKPLPPKGFTTSADFWKKVRVVSRQWVGGRLLALNKNYLQA